MSVREDEVLIAKKYFQTNMSVGEIVARKELLAMGVKNPELVITRLLEIGFIERGEGCYNLVRQKKFHNGSV